MIKAIIVDDMPLAIATLKKDIETHFPKIEILETALGVVTGAKTINNMKPDLIFLDIQMQDGDGFDLLDLLKEPLPKVIFTTASDSHAVKAFQYAAIDYILKPIDIELLSQAIQKAALSMETSQDQIQIAQKALHNEEQSRIALNTQQELKIVEILDIVRCESFSNYTTFHFSNKEKIVVTKPLKEYEKLLKDKGFLRTHQSHLVNMDYVQSFQKSDGGYLLLKDESMIPVSVRKRPTTLEALKNI